MRHIRRARMIRIALLCLLAAGSVPLRAQSPPAQVPANTPTQTPTKNYAQTLVDATLKRHPKLVELDIHAKPPGSDRSVIIAAKSADRVGHASDPHALEVDKTRIPRVEINRTGDYNVEIEIPLFDDHRKSIGSIEMTFPYV